VIERGSKRRAFSESDGKPGFKEASNEIELDISSFAWIFNKRPDLISLDRFIYPPPSFATSDLSRLDSF
jgi:hypothetical protein